MDIARNGEYWGEPDVVAYNKQKMNIYSSIVLLKPLKVVEAFAMTEKP